MLADAETGKSVGLSHVIFGGKVWLCAMFFDVVKAYLTSFGKLVIDNPLGCLLREKLRWVAGKRTCTGVYLISYA